MADDKKLSDYYVPPVRPQNMQHGQRVCGARPLFVGLFGAAAGCEQH